MSTACLWSILQGTATPTDTHTPTKHPHSTHTQDVNTRHPPTHPHFHTAVHGDGGCAQRCAAHARGCCWADHALEPASVPALLEDCARPRLRKHGVCLLLSVPGLLAYPQTLSPQSTLKHIYSHACAHAHTYRHIHPRTYKHTRTHARAGTHIRASSHTHAHTHTHSPYADCCQAERDHATDGQRTRGGDP